MSTTTVPSKRAYRPPEVAEILDVALPTVYGWVRRGVIPLPGRKRKQAIVIPAWRVEAFLATGDWDHPSWRPTPGT